AAWPKTHCRFPASCTPTMAERHSSTAGSFRVRAPTSSPASCFRKYSAIPTLSKYVGACTFVYTSLGVEKFGTAGLAGTLVFHRSTDCGHTWQGPFDIPPSINPNGLVDINGDAVDTADKELADIDPDTGRYGVCWSNFTTAARVEISCTYSDNISSATPTFAPRRVIAARLQDGQGSSLRFAGNGSPLAVVAWTAFPGGFFNRISLAVS